MGNANNVNCGCNFMTCGVTITLDPRDFNLKNNEVAISKACKAPKPRGATFVRVGNSPSYNIYFVPPRI